jgi:hypothetical protein
MKNTILWNGTPYSLVEINWRFAGMYYLHLQGQRVSQASSKQSSSVNFYQTTPCKIQEGSTLYDNCRENLKSHIFINGLVALTWRGHSPYGHVSVRAVLEDAK